MKTQPMILVIGSEASLVYLLGRFAERSGYELNVNAGNALRPANTDIRPAVVIFLSVELLARDQALIAKFASLDVPILVCSSASEEARAIELGADYCLLHPLTYDDFCATLGRATAAKRV